MQGIVIILVEEGGDYTRRAKLNFWCTVIFALNTETVTTMTLSISLTQMSIIKQVNSPIPTYYECQSS